MEGRGEFGFGRRAGRCALSGAKIAGLGQYTDRNCAMPTLRHRSAIGWLPASRASSSTSSSLPSRYRRAVRGTRARSAVISRLARRSAKLSRYCPPAYIKATTTAARYSANTSAASIESAATTSNPTSPRRKLTTISISRTRRTGNVAEIQIVLVQLSRPESCARIPMSRPAAGIATIAGRSSL